MPSAQGRHQASAPPPDDITAHLGNEIPLGTTAHLGNGIYVSLVIDSEAQATRPLLVLDRSPASLAAEDSAPAYVRKSADEAHALPSTEGVGELLVLLTRSALERAQEATQPFRTPGAENQIAGTEDSGGGTGRLLTALVRLLEGARLLGPGPEMRLHPIASLVGPTLTTSQVVRATGTSRQNLAAQAKKRRLVRLASSQRTQWWPTFQFRRVGDRVVPDPAVQALWAALPAGTASDWDHAAWLCTPRHDLDGDAPIDLVTDEDAINRPPLRDVLVAYVDRLVR